MNQKFVFSILVNIIFCTQFVLAQTITTESFQKLMTLSGITKQVAEYPALIISGMNQSRLQGPPISEVLFTELTNATSSAFQASYFLDAIGHEIKSNVSEENAQKLFVWYESKLGKHVTQLEESASTPQAFQEMIQNARSLFAKKERLAMASTLDSFVNATEMTYQTQRDIALAVFSAISQANEEHPTKAINAFKIELDSQKGQMLNNSKQMVLLSLVYSYQSLDIEDLKQYLNFVGHPDTKAFNDATMKGLTKGFQKSTELLSTAAAKVFTKVRINKNKESILENLATE
ncbi:MAG: hypothetical protein KC646_00570 [Candidatus Cloacimonetes bacterium]|nr:hypothetical protein [Candidatus Cloacimonadota bacterium]